MKINRFFYLLFFFFVFRFLDHEDDDVSQNVSGFGYSYLAVLKQVQQSMGNICCLVTRICKRWDWKSNILKTRLLPNGSPVARGAYDLLSGDQNFKQEARTGA